MPSQTTHVTRERVIAPPERFIGVSDGDLLSFFQGVFPPEQEDGLAKLHEMFEGLCTTDFSKLRRALEQDFTYFGQAATGRSCPKKLPSSEIINDREQRFLSNFLELLNAGQYSLLSKTEWEACKDEDFLMTLPVVINYDSMDDKMLPRALWPQHQDVRESLPDEVGDRALIFHRGVDVVKMQGMYIMLKIDLIISFFILQPVFKLFAWIVSLFGVKKYVPISEAPSYMASFNSDTNPDTSTSPSKKPFLARTNTHAHSISVERQTFARVFPNGTSVFKQLFKKIELQEASFKDVVVLYRKAVGDKGIPAGEMDIVVDAAPAFLQRNMVIKRFNDIPLADLDMVFPDFKIFMPPQVAVNMAVTAIGAIAAIFAAFQGGMDTGVLMSTLSLLGTRAAQVYTTANFQKTNIERSLQKILYERSVASQEAVLSTLIEEMAKQRIRELLVCYCILAHANGALSPAVLDKKCESFLNKQYGVAVDFACEQALDTLTEWGVVNLSSTGEVQALPLDQALTKIDQVWDGLFDFQGLVSPRKSSISGVAGRMNLSTSTTRRKAAARAGTTTTTTTPSGRKVVDLTKGLTFPDTTGAALPPAAPGLSSPVTTTSGKGVGVSPRDSSEKKKKGGIFGGLHLPGKKHN